MEIVVAFVGAAIVVIVAAYVAQPLLAKTRAKALAEDSPRERLLAERDTVYAAIRDLDFDFQTGKLLEADYRAVRDRYAARGVAILKELDATPEIGRPKGGKPDAGGRKSENGDRRAEATDDIEAMVRARRKTSQPSQEDEIEAAVRARRKSPLPSTQSPIPNAQPPLSSLNCPKCGRPVDASDRFCAKCGAPLTVEAAC